MVRFSGQGRKPVSTQILSIKGSLAEWRPSLTEVLTSTGRNDFFISNSIKMKALNELNNTERAFILAKLLPEHLKDIVTFIEGEIEHFRKGEEAIRKAWPKNIMATAGYWYMLIGNAELIIRRFNIMLHKSPRIFADHLFYSHNSVFAIHCLVKYAGSGQAPHRVRLAVELLFGDHEVKTLEFTKVDP